MKTTSLPENRIILTVMIPVRNEEAFIANTLSFLEQQDLPKPQYEIIVVDGRSTDSTCDVVTKFAANHPTLNLRLLDNPNKLSSSARNLAVNNAQGDYILLIDGHVYIDNPSLLRNYLDAANNHHALVLGRPQPLSPPDINRFQQDLAIIRGSKLAHSGESFIYSDYSGWTSPISIGVMYHKSLFETVGGFDENFDAAEDLEFNYRLEKAGHRCFTAPELKVFYYPRSNLKALFKQLQRYGYGRALFIAKHPERLTIETLIPAAFVIFLALIIPSFLLNRKLGALLFAVYVIYLTIVLLEGVRLSLMNKKNLVWPTMKIIHTIHTALGSGFLKGIVTSLKTKTRR